jgi:hypothetical protein
MAAESYTLLEPKREHRRERENGFERERNGVLTRERDHMRESENGVVEIFCGSGSG